MKSKSDKWMIPLLLTGLTIIVARVIIGVALGL